MFFAKIRTFAISFTISIFFTIAIFPIAIPVFSVPITVFPISSPIVRQNVINRLTFPLEIIFAIRARFIVFIAGVFRFALFNTFLFAAIFNIPISGRTIFIRAGIAHFSALAFIIRLVRRVAGLLAFISRKEIPPISQGRLSCLFVSLGRPIVFCFTAVITARVKNMRVPLALASRTIFDAFLLSRVPNSPLGARFSNRHQINSRPWQIDLYASGWLLI